MPSQRRPTDTSLEAYWGRERDSGSEADSGPEADPLVRAPLGIEGTFPIPGAPISSVLLAHRLDSVPETPRVSVAFAPAATDAEMPWREAPKFGARVRSWFSPTGAWHRRGK